MDGINFVDAGTYETGKDSFTRMHKEMHDDDYIKEHMRKESIKQIRKDKVSDTGL